MLNSGKKINILTLMLSTKKILNETKNNAPRAHSRMSNIDFDIWIWVETLYIFHEQLMKDGKVVCLSGIKSKVLPGSLTDLSV